MQCTTPEKLIVAVIVSCSQESWGSALVTRCLGESLIWLKVDGRKCPGIQPSLPDSTLSLSPPTANCLAMPVNSTPWISQICFYIHYHRPWNFHHLFLCPACTSILLSIQNAHTDISQELLAMLNFLLCLSNALRSLSSGSGCAGSSA